jgi:peptidoglycan DL-endopeptidase CwlO
LVEYIYRNHILINYEEFSNRIRRGDIMKQILTKFLAALLILAILPFNTVSAATPDQEEVVRIAKSNLGVPYVWGGTTPKGFDCSGFMTYVFGKVGIDLPRTSSEQYSRAGVKVSKSDLQPGDLVFFEKTYSKAGVTHAGIYIGNNEFISATSSKGIKIDSLSSTYWGPKYYGAKRVLTSTPGVYSDVPKSHVAYDAIYTLGNKNIIMGYEDNTFRPDEPVTRGQAAAIMNRKLKKVPKSLSAFKDVPTSSRFAKDIAAIKELGIINGFKDGTFRPNEYMTRAEMAVIVQNAFKLQGSSYSKASSTYSDITPSYWAHDAIVTMSTIDSTSIFEGSKYYATHRATRAFFSAAIYNSINATN